MKRRQTKRGRVSLCRREFTAKDWRGKEGVLRLRRGKGSCSPDGYRQAVWPPGFFPWEVGALRLARRPSTDFRTRPEA